MMTTLLTFDTTHHALRAEQIALERGLGAQVVPAPAEAKAKCALALECLDEDLPALRSSLEAERVAYALFVSGRSGAGSGPAWCP